MIKKNQLDVARQSSEVDFNKIMNQLAEEKKEQDKEKIAKIKAKVLTVARFNRMLKNAKENSEIITKAKQISPDGKLPAGTLIKASSEIKSDVGLFLQVRKLDSENEKLPTHKVAQAVERRKSIKNLNQLNK